MLASVSDAISSIIITMHREDFGFDASAGSESASQCSLFMRELQTFVLRIQEDYLSLIKCGDVLSELCLDLAARACQEFIHHAGRDLFFM